MGALVLERLKRAEQKARMIFLKKIINVCAREGLWMVVAAFDRLSWSLMKMVPYSQPLSLSLTHTHDQYTNIQAAATEGAGAGGDKGVVFTSTVEFSSLLQARCVRGVGVCVCFFFGLLYACLFGFSWMGYGSYFTVYVSTDLSTYPIHAPTNTPHGKKTKTRLEEGSRERVEKEAQRSAGPLEEEEDEAMDMDVDEEDICRY